MAGAQRLVLKAVEKDGELMVTLSDFQGLVRIADKYGLKPDHKFRVEKDGNTFRVVGELPSNLRLVNTKKVKVKQKSKKERDVEKQISDRRNSKKKGDTTPGYVPPVGKKGKPRRNKGTCPVCEVRKPIVTISGVKTIKPHVVKGEPCSGGGTQV